jgi:hypothetical protein
MSDIAKRLYKWSLFGYGVEASEDMRKGAAEITRLTELAAWHEADKARFQDVAATHLREIARLKAEVARKDAAYALLAFAAKKLLDDNSFLFPPGNPWGDNLRAAINPSQEPRT